MGGYFQIYANIILVNGATSGNSWQVNNGSYTSVDNVESRAKLTKNGDLVIAWVAGSVIQGEMYSCNVHSKNFISINNDNFLT